MNCQFVLVVNILRLLPVWRVNTASRVARTLRFMWLLQYKRPGTAENNDVCALVQETQL